MKYLLDNKEVVDDTTLEYLGQIFTDIQEMTFDQFVSLVQHGQIEILLNYRQMPNDWYLPRLNI